MSRLNKVSILTILFQLITFCSAYYGERRSYRKHSYYESPRRQSQDYYENMDSDDAKIGLICGFRTNLNKKTPPPTGFKSRGEIARAGDFPWLVTLVNSSGQHYCCGSIVAREWILTAAHCISPPCRPVAVLAGTTNFNQADRYEVEDFIPYPEYKFNQYGSDIGLVQVSKPFHYSKGDEYGEGAVEPVCMAPPETEYRGTATVAGFGNPNRGDGAVRLRSLSFAIDLDVLSDAICASYWGWKYIPDGQVCAGNRDMTKRDSCKGYSGGPLQTIVNGRVYLIGVTNFGELDCGENNVPGVYAKVSYYRDWVRGIVGV